MDHKIITGLGRSGTTWLGSFLSKYNSRDRDWFAGHELLVYNHNIKGWEDLKTGRFKREKFWKSYYENLARLTQARTVVDVDSFLRFFVPCETAEIALLARNPIDVVKSFMSFGTPMTTAEMMTETGKSEGFNPTLIGMPIKDWEKLTRFQKLCHTWVFSNEYVLHYAKIVFQFGRLLTDWSEMGRLFSFIDLKSGSGTFQDWEEHRKVMVNSTNDDRLPLRWKKWPEECKLDLLKICGPTMKKLGYF